MSQSKWIGWWVVISLVIAVTIWFFLRDNSTKRPEHTLVNSSRIEIKPTAFAAGNYLLDGYGDPATPPLDDLKKIQRVATGYFSVIKDSSRFPIGGNEDLAAALRGENSNREVFVNADHPVFSSVGLLTDRWGSPLIVHPESWRVIELRSAGPDKVPYNEDDLVLDP